MLAGRRRAPSHQTPASQAPQSEARVQRSLSLGVTFHLETAAKLLISQERVLADFSKYALKLLDNQADFVSAIRRFESSRPSHEINHLGTETAPATGLGYHWATNGSRDR